MAAGQQDIDFGKLESYLRALAYASRLELLHQLRMPRPLSEIRIQAQQSRPGDNPERPMSRQSLQDHLDQLVEAGVVVPVGQQREGPGRPATVYTVSPQRLFAILEELRRVCSFPVHPSASEADTAPIDARPPRPHAPGPKLVLVHGLYDGKAFPLPQGDGEPATSWLIGRREGLPVALDYDPYVSTENAEVRRGESGFALRSLPDARNGTMHNWRQLAPGEQVPLVSGDVVGVGRSLLVFREN